MISHVSWAECFPCFQNSDINEKDYTELFKDGDHSWYIYCVCLFSLFPIFFYLHTDDVKILSSFFYHQNFFSAFSLMKSWLTRMNSLQSFLYVATLQWNLYRKNWNDSVVTCLIAWLYILRTINALILFTDLTKMIYQHADFVKINEIIEYNILSILWKGFVTLPNQ